LEKGIYAHLHNNGDEKSKIDAVIARQVVFLSNLRLVIGYARKYYKSPLPIDDLTQEGNIGLAKAIDHYDYRRKVKFSTYATWWIWQAIVRADRHLGRKIRLPEHVHDIRVQLYKAADRLYTRNSREPSPEEIAEEIDHPVEYVLENMSFQEPLSLNENVDYESGLERGQLIEDVTDVENETLEAIDNDDIMHIIFNESGLTLAEQFILSMRRGIPVEGLKGEKIVISRQFKGQHISREIIYENWLAKIILEDGLTLETIGEIFGVTRERIRQKENDILEKLHGLKALSDRR
jgi:RNA polymerase sigma factor (sigma-70 family)